MVTINKSNVDGEDIFDVLLETTNFCMRKAIVGLGGVSVGTMMFNEGDMVKQIIERGIPRFTYTVKEPGCVTRVMKVVASDELW